MKMTLNQNSTPTPLLLLFAIPGSNRVQLLSDDGGIVVGGLECKKLPAANQRFRSFSVAPWE